MSHPGRSGNHLGRKEGKPFDPQHGLQASVLIDPIAAASLFTGAPQSLEQVLDEADKNGGRPNGFALTPAVTIAVATKVRRFSSPEVIGIIEGADARLKDEYVALMAHADHIGIKAQGPGDRINNGALDNGAGVATLIEVARAFMTAPERPRRSILVVANTAEEKGLLGAEYFAHYPTVPIERVTAAIDLDMPMLLYDFTDVVAYGAGHSTLEGVFARGRCGDGREAVARPDAGTGGLHPFGSLPDGRNGRAGRDARDRHGERRRGGLGQVPRRPTIISRRTISHSRSSGRPARSSPSSITAWSGTLPTPTTRAQWYSKDYFGDLFAPTASKATRPAQ